MTSFIDGFRAEITRLARKEVRKEVAPLKAQVQKLRKDVLALKSAAIYLKRELDSARKGSLKQELSLAATETTTKHRYRAGMIERFAKKHNLGGTEIAKLLNGSPAAAYRWLDGQRPRDRFIDAFYQVKDLSKKEIAALLGS